MERVRTADYLAFLLRLWREDKSGPWRALLVDPHTGERRGFADLGKLFVFLQDQTDRGMAEVKAVTGARERRGRC